MKKVVESHDCLFPHADEKDLVCEKCVVLKGCSKIKMFPNHDCYYPNFSEENHDCLSCFHRFHCTKKHNLPKVKFKFQVKQNAV